MSVSDMTATPALEVNRTAVEWSRIYGRYLVASEPVQRGELLVQEQPLAIGPKCNGYVLCLACYRPDVQERCSLCGWPLCSICNGNATNPHLELECSVLQLGKARFYEMPAGSLHWPQLDCIMPLRVLLAKEAQPERWLNEVAPMEHHEQARRENADVWHADRVNIAQYLRGPCKLAERFSEELIMQVVGVLEVNAFEARTSQGYPLRCLYPYTGILAHNCVPNTARSIHPSEGYKIRLRAMVALEAGQQLQHSYTYTLDGTAQRQAHLREGKYFSCSCERCLDASELQTHFSSMKCGQCTEGWLLPKHPTAMNSSWNCRACDHSTSSVEVRQIVAALQAEVNAVQALDMGPKRLEESERLLRKYKSLLHPSHYIATSLRQLLIEMYGRVQGYEMVQLTDQLLERKASLCREVLRVLNIFEPGLSRARAMNLYELHVPLVLLAKSGFIASKLSGGELRARLVDAIDLLKECVEILQHEDQRSQEGILCGVAKQALQQLTISVEGLGSELD
ncbi:SET domain-containing protein SmydA-8 isoform X1 [Drosophila novamexicana]|uniref:SET domain-containing protein SmydA-8 isoform X1 n=1 Tax=Drosophila novamexicana TaxID=47314 RepID=UPI0011E5A0CD|nr:SET domain-containing protein SmydA-8 isoform X1 [Drosophila novamexicana]